jgi:tyrosyl-tRNA synthetase
MLDEHEIESNAATFQEQALLILDGDPERLEVRRNSEWLDMPMSDLLALVRTTTVAQMVERDDFAKRLQASDPVSMLELLYPLLQGYDSVAVRADVELGGTDQKFNLLLGRDIQRAYGQPEQAIMTLPILVGTDGSRKMSKSLGNQIGVTDPPEEMYGKLMSIPDAAMPEYYRLLLAREPPAGWDTAVTGGGEGTGAAGADDGAGAAGAAGSRARDAKRELARAIVSWLHSDAAAEEAARHFERVTVQGLEPEKIEDAVVSAEEGAVHLPAVIQREFGLSRSEARRLIDQGGVTLGERTLAPGEHDVSLASAEGEVLRVGKRRFRRLRAG